MMSDKMSSVSNSSKFSIKLQQVMAKQDGQIAAMRKMLIDAGVSADVDDMDAGAGAMEIDLADPDSVANSRKRLPSGSPEGKVWGQSNSDDSYDDAIDAMEEKKSRGDWREEQLKKGKKNPNKLSKKEAKKARRLAKAKLGKKESDARNHN